ESAPAPADANVHSRSAVRESDDVKLGPLDARPGSRVDGGGQRREDLHPRAGVTVRVRPPDPLREEGGIDGIRIDRVDLDATSPARRARGLPEEDLPRGRCGAVRRVALADEVERRAAVDRAPEAEV